MLENFLEQCCPNNPIIWFPVSLIIYSIIIFLLSIFPLNNPGLPLTVMIEQNKKVDITYTILVCVFIFLMSMLWFVIVPLVIFAFLMFLPMFGSYYVHKCFVSYKKKIVEEFRVNFHKGEKE